MLPLGLFFLQYRRPFAVQPKIDTIMSFSYYCYSLGGHLLAHDAHYPLRQQSLDIYNRLQSLLSFFKQRAEACQCVRDVYICGRRLVRTGVTYSLYPILHLSKKQIPGIAKKDNKRSMDLGALLDSCSWYDIGKFLQTYIKNSLQQTKSIEIQG